MKISLKCERTVAFDSPDHLIPWGTRRDNSRNMRFNNKLFALFGKSFPNVLDLGCSGGGFVKDCLDAGCVAVGLEGSDYSKKHKRAEWATIPDYLFTCDITKNFQLYLSDADGKEGKRPIRFDVVTSWEVMEHIATLDIPGVCQNVSKHLKVGGLWIMSISGQGDEVQGVQLHQTIKPKPWWAETFRKNGFVHVPELERYFRTQYVQGKYDNESGFHLIFTNDRSKLPGIPWQSSYDALLDYWIGSRHHELIRRALLGY